MTPEAQKVGGYQNAELFVHASTQRRAKAFLMVKDKWPK